MDHFGRYLSHWMYQKFSKNLKIGEKVALRNLEGVILATIQVGSKWSPDKFREADKVFKQEMKHILV